MNYRMRLWNWAWIPFVYPAFGGPSGTIHYPDLVTLPPSDIRIEYDFDTRRKLLRFSNRIVNLGEGPLEVAPRNNADNGTTEAYQHLYGLDTNNDWQILATNRVGTFVFHPAHEHWHFENF